MTISRREFCYLGASASLLTGLSPLVNGAQSTSNNPKSDRLFFDKNDIEQIRANAASEFLGPLYRNWSSHPPSELSEKLDAFNESRDIIGDFGTVLETLTYSSMTQIIDPSQERRDSLIKGIERFIEFPFWDYFLDGPNDAIGIQRAATAIVRLLFAREVLEGEIDAKLDRRLLSAIAEKGCLPCYRTVHGMDNPDTVKGWRFDKRHADYYDIDMSRWPEILGANNLRAAPSSALGIGAIALRGHDPRADLWLETAIASSRRVLPLFSPDGSYFEGISYAGYTLRTTLGFFEAHQRCIGDIDWAEEANMEGIVEFILSTQMGLQEDGSPDIANFSDAKNSVYPCVPSWIARHTNNPLAQYTAENASKPYYFLDFLWYEPNRKSKSPPAALKNVHNDLDWVLSRSGWGPNDAVVAFKSGGPANHEHSDRNHFIYKIHGERLINDNFGAAYDRRHAHWLLRQTEAHNAVLIDGKGHHYHDGIEGTNESLSYANITQYHVNGGTTWWSSDATSAYKIENEHIFKVVRTVIFSKPDIVIVLDQIRLRYQPQRVDLRYFPDNRDNEARLNIDGNQFSIQRPNATLHAQVTARSGTSVTKSILDLPKENGDFPFIEISSKPALYHEVLTLMAATPGKSGKSPNIKAKPVDGGWEIRAGNLKATLKTDRMTPTIQIS